MTTTINADNGVSSGSAGLKSSADSSGVLALQTNGTTALSIDASQVVSFSGSLCASYQWTDWDPTNLSGSATNAPSTAAATVTATNYMTMANSSGTVTFTFTKAGNYFITITGENEYANSPVRGTDKVTMYITLGGTVTRLFSVIQSVIGLFASDIQMSGVNAGPGGSMSFLVTATANQTLTILPTARCSISTGGAVTTQFTYSCNATATYVGA